VGSRSQSARMSSTNQELGPSRVSSEIGAVTLENLAPTSPTDGPQCRFCLGFSTLFGQFSRSVQSESGTSTKRSPVDRAAHVSVDNPLHADKFVTNLRQPCDKPMIGAGCAEKLQKSHRERSSCGAIPPIAQPCRSRWPPHWKPSSPRRGSPRC
jgi:hypothetical protein